MRMLTMENFTADNISSYPCPNDTVCILEATFVIGVTFLTLGSNIVNIAVLVTTPAFRNSHGYLLLSLSVADLGTGAVAALSIYPSATLRDSLDSWPYGNTVCMISTYALQIFLSNSGLTLTFMSIERYIAVAHPLKYSRLVTKNKTLIYIAIGWILVVSVFAVGVPNHMYAGYVYTCVPLLDHDTVFAQILFVVEVLPGLIVIVITSVIVSKELKKNAKRLANPTPSSSSQARSSQGTSPRSIKLFRMVRVMTVAVLVCWFPFLSLIIVEISFEIVVPQVIYFLTFWTLLSNGYINSIIYFVMNKTFHDRVKEICERLNPLCCRQLNEFEKNLDCTFCICREGIKVDLKTSGDNTNNITHRDTHDNSVELVKVKVKGVDNEGF